MATPLTETKTTEPIVTGIEYIRIPDEMRYFLLKLERMYGIAGFKYDPVNDQSTLGVELGRSE